MGDYLTLGKMGEKKLGKNINKITKYSKNNKLFFSFHIYFYFHSVTGKSQKFTSFHLFLLFC